MDKATLLNRLYDNRTRFEQVISHVSEAKMIEPMGKEQQSGKDIIAHLTVWEQRAMRWLQTAARGGTPQSPEPGATWDDMDRLNAQTQAQNRQRSLQKIQADSQRSFQELAALIQTFSDQALNITRPYAWAWQGDSPEAGRPLWKSILASPCYTHYQSHFYDFLIRTGPDLLFAPDMEIMRKYEGSYKHDQRGSIVFRTSDNALWLRTPQQEQECSGIAVDNTHIAFKGFGLVTFHTDAAGKSTELEWWLTLFPRNA